MMSPENRVTAGASGVAGDSATAGRRKILAVLRSANYYSFYILFLLLGCCTLFYYFGELVEFAGWEALRWNLLYGVHDIHRLLFLAPILYAGYVFGVKATVMVTLIALIIFLPRAIFLSTFPDPLLRMVIFTIIAGVMGYLTATTRRESRRRSRLEDRLISERDSLLGILERMVEGVLITGPDYRVRFMNRNLVRDFGEGVGSYCYQCLHGSDEPCPEICRLPDVINGAIERWEYDFPGGKTYEVLASPYVDLDGVICQVTIFRKIVRRKKVEHKLLGSTD